MPGVLRSAASNWVSHNAPRLGAALAYYAVLSLMPALLIGLAISGAALGPQAIRGEVYWQIRDVAGAQIAGAVESILKSAYQPKVNLIAGAVGFVAMLVGASGVFVELRDTLNYIWNAPATAMKFWALIRERFLSFAMVIGAGVILTASVAVTALVQTARDFLGHYLSIPAPLLAASDFFASLAVTALLFALIYSVIPEVHVDWRDVAVGSILTAVLFSAGRILIGLYIGRAGVGSTYGSAGTLVVLLVWVYYSAQIFLFGAEFTYAYSQRRGSKPVPAAAQSDERPQTPFSSR